jgi:TPR repeat protein
VSVRERLTRAVVVATFAGTQAACGAIEAPSPNAPRPPEVASVCAVGGCAPIASTVDANVETCAAHHDCARDPATVCDKTNAHACTTRALDAWAVAAGDTGIAPVLALFERACDLGDSYGCMYAGRIALDGVGVVPDEARGRMLLERACDAEVVLACDTLARHERDAPPVASEKQFGGTRYETEAACWRGVAGQCFNVGLYFGAGRDGYPHDDVRSARAYTRGCDQGDSTSCNNLANDLYYGDGVPIDWAQSARLYIRACDGGNAVGCANVGYLAEYGDGVPLDMKKAERSYADACSLGSAYGCVHLDMLAAYRSGVPHAPEQAAARWRSACESPAKSADRRACAFYGVLFEDGKGVAHDSDRATSLMKVACEGHYKPACEWGHV